MTTITFDTLKFVETLQAGEFSESQAKALSTALKDVQQEAELATKADLRELEQRMNGEFRLLRWILAFIAAGIVVPLLRDMF